jgi:hypothetical protein
MQIPQQPPEDEQRQASQPLYEFVTDSSLPAVPAITPGGEQDGAEHVPSADEQPAPERAGSDQPSDGQATPAASDRSPDPSPSAEAIRQGLVYPPPPSFYQNAQEDTSRAPVPPVPSASPGTATLSSPGGLPPGAPVVGPGSEYIPPPAFVPLPPPGMMPPVRQSRKWMWIVIAMLGGVLLLSCGLCSWAGYMLVAPTVQDQTDALSLVNNYYEAIQSRNYTAAYADLAPQGTIKDLTREQFIQQAQSRDSQYGSVRSYVAGQPSPVANTGGGNTTSLSFSRMTITVSVARAHLNYNVLLTLEKVNGSWKIVDFDGV